MGLSALLPFLIYAALVVYPFWLILPRVGLNPWISLAAIIPVGAVILLWVVALRPWQGS